MEYHLRNAKPKPSHSQKDGSKRMFNPTCQGYDTPAREPLPPIHPKPQVRTFLFEGKVGECQSLFAAWLMLTREFVALESFVTFLTQASLSRVLSEALLKHKGNDTNHSSQHYEFRLPSRQ